MDAKFADIIIPFADSIKELKLTIDSLIEQKNLINKILVIVSGKSKNILYKKIIKYEEIYKENLNIKIILDDAIKTTAGTARNKGINYSKADYIAFIDSGMTVEQEWLNSFRSLSQKEFIRLGCTRFKPQNKRQLISALLTYGTKDAKLKFHFAIDHFIRNVIVHF